MPVRMLLLPSLKPQKGRHSHVTDPIDPVPEVFPDQAKARQSAEAESSHPAVDPSEDGQHHTVGSPKSWGRPLFISFSLSFLIDWCFFCSPGRQHKNGLWTNERWVADLIVCSIGIMRSGGTGGKPESAYRQGGEISLSYERKWFL